jgi:tripartite-type tricarboxylate transporter receptor subunit TctC
MKNGIRSAVLVVALIAPTVQSNADAVADFYRGKSLRMIIGYPPGTGYDRYARLAAEFLPRHIPGNPSIVPRSMLGRDGEFAARYLYESAPKDGTVLGSLSQKLALDRLTNPKFNLDIARFSYLGRLVTNIDVGAALPKTGIKSFEDVRKAAYPVGAMGSGSPSVLLPTALNAYGGSKFKLVRGYKGTTDILVGMERGDVDVIGAFGLPSILASKPEWIDKGAATILYQAAFRRHRLLPHVPALPELAITEEGRALLRAVSSAGEIGRSILTTPDVPAERLAALRKAFAGMLADPGFLAAAKQRKLMLDPGAGAELDAILQDTLKLPKPLAARIAAMMK